MASPKMCFDCDRVTFASGAEATAHGWLHLFLDRWNDLWRCPACQGGRR